MTACILEAESWKKTNLMLLYNDFIYAATAGKRIYEQWLSRLAF